MMRPFERFNARLARYPASYRCLVDAHGHATEGDWRLLALEARDRADTYCADPVHEFEPPKRTRPHHGTATRTSTGAGRVRFDDDPLKRIPAAVYLPALAGTEVASTGRCRCPMPDHEDIHPSRKAYGPLWKCFSCGAGNTIIDLASELSGIATTGSDYWRLRDWVLERLVWAPLPSQRRSNDG